MARAASLYTPTVLALATELAGYPAPGTCSLQGRARSPACGSQLDLGLDLAADGTIAAIGLSVVSCAIGQASAAIFARAAKGHSIETLAASRSEIESWLAGATPLPAWPGLDAIAAAQAYPARHGAVLLPWKAALSALSSVPRHD